MLTEIPYLMSREAPVVSVLEDRILVPFKEDYHMYYKVYNPETLGESTPLICVHGMAGNSACFDYLGRAINDFPVVSIDVVGRGKSSWLNDHSHYNYNTYCVGVLHLAKHLNIKECNYLGTSMGGLIAMFLAAHFHNALKIKKLILNDIGPCIEEKPLKALVELMTRLPTFSDKGQVKPYLKTVLRHFGVEKEEHWDHLAQNRVMEKEGGGYALTLDPGIGIQLALEVQQALDAQQVGGHWEIWDVWQRVQCGEILVLRGENSDLLTQDILQRMLQSRQHITCIEYPGIGHAPTLMAESRIKAVEHFVRAN